MKQSANKCVICGAPIDGVTDFGANPAPIRNLEEGRCCSWCDQHIVIPVRFKRDANGLNPYGDDEGYERAGDKADCDPEEICELDYAERVIELLNDAYNAGVINDVLNDVLIDWDGSASELLERLKRYILDQVFWAYCDDAGVDLLRHYI